METADLIIKGDYVLPMSDGVSVIEDGAVAVKGAKIAAVGATSEIEKKYSGNAIYGGKGRAVIPGLVNTHTHAAMVFMRGMADDLPLKTWLQEHIWPAENRWLGAEFVHDAVELAAVEMLKAGVTTFNDMYFFESVAAEVSKAIGIRAVLGAGIIDFPTKTTKDADDCLQKAEAFIKNWKDDELVTPAVAPHAVYSCSAETLEKSLALAKKYDVHLHTHVSETHWEEQEVRKKYGKAPAVFLDELGVLSEKVLAAHCVWVDDEEIEVLAGRKVAVSHCPESNLKLASGIAPVAKMLRAGIKVSLGTDGAASNNDLDVMSEMHTAAKLHKAVDGDPTSVTARQALLMATRWGAEGIGLGAVSGTLEPGKAADIVTIDLDTPHMTPLYDICSHLVYAARASDVRDVLVNGKAVVRDGRITTADESEIIEKARAWGAKIRRTEL